MTPRARVSPRQTPRHETLVVRFDVAVDRTELSAIITRLRWAFVAAFADHQVFLREIDMEVTLYERPRGDRPIQSFSELRAAAHEAASRMARRLTRGDGMPHLHVRATLLVVEDLTELCAEAS